MFYCFIVFSLLLMSNHFKTNLLWNYTKLMTYIELWSNSKNKDELMILNIYKLQDLKNEIINKKNYIFYNFKLTINNSNELQNYLIKFKFKNINFRIILNNQELKRFDFKFTNVLESKYLSILNEDNQDLTDIINQYSGPERNFYKKQINFNLENIYQDYDFKTKKNKFKIVNNNADEIEINNIKDLII